MHTAGLGFKPQHFDEALAATEPGLWLEVHPENHLAAGGPRAAMLEVLSERHPVSLHGVSLSLAGTEPIDTAHLARLAALVRRVRPARVSEHLAWSAFAGAYLPDLLPIARSTDALQRTASRIAQVQDALGVRIAIENPAHYLRFPEGAHAWSESDFLAELVHRTGCGLLLDVANVHVAAHNLGIDPAAYLDAYLDCAAADAVVEIHLAGHSSDPQLGDALLVDSHDAPVADAVWALYARAIARLGPVPTLIERDGNVPAWPVLLTERTRAHALLVAQAVPA